MKTVIVTEKPSVAQTFAKVLGVTERHDGYLESENYIITWCVGHLVTLAYPEVYDPALKKWELATLPFLPEEYKYEVIENVKHQFSVVKTIYNRKDVGKIYYAGDPGREGAYIQALVRQKAGRNPSAEERVVWIDSQTETEINRGIKEAKPFEAYLNLIASGYERGIEDYASGINFSRLITLKYGNLANNAALLDEYKPISVGRVMSCVLGMVVRREREVLNFVSTPFYKINNTISFNGIPLVADWRAVEGSKVFESPLLYNETGFRKEEDAINFISGLPTDVRIEKVEKETEKKYAPLLFNLAELQNQCSKRFKISPDETLEIAQSLYEKKLTTYPRTDARVLSTAIAVEVRNNIAGFIGLEEAPSLSHLAEEIIQKGWDGKIKDTKYTDDSKVTDHYAIIPTGEGFSELYELSEMEMKVYELIVRRFFSIFFPPAEYFKVKIEQSANNERFFATGKILNQEGYLKVVGPAVDNEEKLKKVTALSALKEGERYNASYECTKGETTPPKRYTSGDMVLAMENAGQLIEEEDLRAQIKENGIGTSATRAETIKKLIGLEYIQLNKKTQVLTPTAMGNIIYEILDMTIPSILNPKMTASWEKGLEQIVKGEVEPQLYRKKLEDFIRREAEKIIQNDLTDELTKRILPYAKTKDFNNEPKGSESVILNTKCPLCNGSLKTTKYGCVCENYSKEADGCKFAIGQIAGVVLSAKELETLLSTGNLPIRDGFVSKTKKKFKAGLSFKVEKDENDQNKPKMDFVFPQKEDPKETDVECFKCKQPMKKNTWNYECSCGYKISHTVAGKSLSEEIIKTLLKERKTNIISGFTSKKKKPFKASLKLNDNGEIEFEFEKKK